jgi:hypothetical protein
LAAVDLVAGPVEAASPGEGAEGVLEVLGHRGSGICVGVVSLINLGVV